MYKPRFTRSNKLHDALEGDRTTYRKIGTLFTHSQPCTQKNDFSANIVLIY